MHYAPYSKIEGNPFLQRLNRPIEGQRRRNKDYKRQRIVFNLHKDGGDEIRHQGKETAERERLDSIAQTEKDLLRLEEGKQEMLQLRRQRAIGQVCQRVITRALSQVRKTLDHRLDPDFHQSVNYFILVLFSNDACWGGEKTFYLPSWNITSK